MSPRRTRRRNSRTASSLGDRATRRRSRTDPLVHEELRRLAQRGRRRERRNSLQATALVNEELTRLESIEIGSSGTIAPNFSRNGSAEYAPHPRGLGARTRESEARRRRTKVSLEEALQDRRIRVVRFGGARRCAQDTRSDGSSEGSGGGDAVLRWIDDRRECRGAAMSPLTR